MDQRQAERNIVIAEDSHTQATLLVHSLEKMGYTVHHGKDGLQALALVHEYDPILVISDIVMPEMDGYALIKAIRSAKAISHIPILLLTTLSGMEDIMRGLEIGADSYLLKPFNDSYLESRLNHILENRKQLLEGRNDTPFRVTLDSEEYAIRSGAPVMLNLLFSSYESAVNRNLELETQQQELREVTDLLRQKVEQRKTELETELIQIEEAGQVLMASEARFREWVENALVGIFIWNMEGRVVQCNECFLELMKCDSQDALRNRKIFDHFTSAGEAPDLFEELENSGTVNEFETILVDMKGSKSTVLVSAGVQDQLISGMVLDISDRKEAEVRLQLQNQQIIKEKETAELSEKLQTSFLANMSNEILNPLNAVAGFSELMNNPEISQENLKHYAEQINRSGNHLISITESIIDIARVETGEMKIRKDTCVLNSLLLDVFAHSKKLIQDSSKPELELLLNRELKDPDLSFITEPFRLKRIISNLVENAIKYTKKGVIEFGYAIHDKENDAKEDQIQFYVKDTGRGMDQEKLAFIFDRFRQKNTSYIKMSEGAGLGLPLTRAYVELLGGQIWCNSEPGKGTEFYFTLPFVQVRGIQKPESRIIRETLSRMDRHVRILIAEDQESNYVLIEALLIELNATLIWAKNGKDALDIFRQQKDIDLILMDLRMPVMNGFEAVEAIRQHDASIPIIVLTAFAREEDREAILNLGCNSFLTKPVKKELLYQEINKFIVVDKDS